MDDHREHQLVAERWGDRDWDIRCRTCMRGEAATIVESGFGTREKAEAAIRNMRSPARSPRQIAKDVLIAAKAAGIVRDYVLRGGGRATIYWGPRAQLESFGNPDGHRGPGKSYTTSALDTLRILRSAGFLETAAKDDQ
jgi:hypothetical protein